MRSEVELWVDAGPHGPRGRASPLSQATSPDQEEASQAPGPGKSPEAAEPPAVGRGA